MKRVYLCAVLFALINLKGIAQTSQYWGTTSEGGTYNRGVIFNTDENGDNYTVAHSFEKDNGSDPEGDLVENNNGRFYGTTRLGGPNDHGILFEFDPINSNYTTLLTFNASTTGKWPVGSLIKAANGNYYGLTSQGGTFNFGVLFELDPLTNTVTNKFNFDGANHGKLPAGSLYEAANGKLYATTSEGGAFDKGVLFEYDYSNNSFTKLIDFDAVQGENPFGSVVQHSNGKLYGMTSSGGLSGYGVIYDYDLGTSSVSVAYHFDGIEGRSPFGNLIEGSNGNLFGLTELGGTISTVAGSLFEFDPSNSSYTQKVNFDLVPSNRPTGSLLEVSNGIFYGTTRFGGTQGFDFGTLFEYNANTDVFDVKVTFNGNANGTRPVGSVIKGSDGKLYGTTKKGGLNDKGTLFKFDYTSDVFTKILDFEGFIGGAVPLGKIVKAPNGLLYGTTFEGGQENRGVLFEWNPFSGEYTKKVDFAGAQNGENPIESMILASNGKLYGLTATGGLNNRGVLYEWDPNSETLTKKYDFNFNDGYFPLGELIEASNGKLYGLTGYGGASDFGVLFEYDLTTDTYTMKAEFDGTNGNLPSGGLVELNNNVLYGMTLIGGSNNNGVLFKYDMPSEVLTKLIDFDGANNGSRPNGDLTSQTINGKAYGMTYAGGSADLGTIFEFDIASETLSSLYDFTAASGNSPEGSLIVGTNDKLYGLTSKGGTSNRGVVFEFDLSANTYLTKTNFDGTLLGATPKGSLSKIIQSGANITETSSNEQLICFPNPTNGHVTLNSKIKATSISIINPSGEIVLEASNTLNMDLGELPEGIYIIKAVIDSNSIVGRIILTK